MILQALHAATTTTTLPASVSKGSSSILDPIAKPIADVLAFFYGIVPNYAFAILALSLVWMVIISPLTLKTTRSMLAMQKLQPEMKRLQEKHRNDRQALAAAQMELYKENNVSPFGSCLPSILPLPVFIALFRVIDGLSHTTTVNGVKYSTPKFLSHNTAMYRAISKSGGHLNAFGLDLAKSALSGHSTFATALPFYVLLLVMMGTQYFQTQQMMSRNPAAQQQNSQMQIMKFLPLIFGVICIRFPAGVVLYYAMSNVCRIGQQFLMYRFDPKVRTLAIKDVVEIEAAAHVEDDEKPASMFSRKPSTTPVAGPAGRGRFRDLLNGAVEQQQASRSKSTERKATPTKGGTTPTKGGTTPAKGGAISRNGSAVPKGANQKAANGAKAGNGTTKPAPNRVSTPPRANGTAAPVGANGNGSKGNGSNGNGSNGSNGNGSAGSNPPANGSSPNQTTPSTNGGTRSGGTPPRTGAGSGRTGAGGRTGAAGGSRNKRQGR
jgi:YidC/Oxa1 family membrane protein insertase